MRNKIVLTLLLVLSLSTGLYAATRRQPSSSSMTLEEENAMIEAAREMRGAGMVQLNFRDMDVIRLMRFMSEVLQENIIMQSGIKQSVTIMSSHPVTIEESRRMMKTALEVCGLTLEETEGCLVVKKASGKPAVTMRPVNVRGGEISSEELERFIASPLEEFLRIRMRYDKNRGGLEVQWIHNDSFFKKLGVQRGDVIRAVNGVNLGGLEDIGRIIQSITKRRSFDVTILRGIEVISLNHTVRTPQPEARKTEAPKQTGNIVAAVPGSKEGQVPGELVSNLVQNPFDELKRIRLRPDEKAGGLEVQWIQNDSLLKRLGVQKGDVIRSLNGVPFRNMGDIANSLSSLSRSSERFDIEIKRGDENITLRYVVK